MEIFTNTTNKHVPERCTWTDQYDSSHWQWHNVISSFDPTSICDSIICTVRVELLLKYTRHVDHVKYLYSDFVYVDFV